MITDFIYGGMDGVITTVAIVAGIIGANISTKYALILGLANLCADAFSMGISRYNSLSDIDDAKNNPYVSALITFVSFLLLGFIPLIPFLFISLHDEKYMKKMLMIFSMIAFFIIGCIKGLYSRKWAKSILEVILIGCVGVYISFNVSKYVKSQVNMI